MQKNHRQLNLFWKKIQDPEVNTLMDCLALIEVTIENKKSVFQQLPKADKMCIRRLEKISLSIRKDLVESAKLSLETRKTFKKILCEIM